MRRYSSSLLVIVLLGTPSASAQSIPAQAAESPTRAQLEQALDGYRRLFADWAGLNRYGSDDAQVPPPQPGENRVVFIGDEVVESWTPFFPGKPYFNRGIARQTTAQMLVRFRQDVVALRPRVVVILAGTNDLANMNGPATRGTFADNMMSMIDLARANGIRVVLAAMTPVCNCTINQTARRSQVRWADWNEWMQRYAGEAGAIFLDWSSALAEGRDFRRELTSDGWLPNAAGYEIMARLAEQAIGRALARN